MSRTVALLLVTLIGISGAAAQEVSAGAGRLEVTAFPGGGIFFTEGSSTEPNFGNYALGISFTANANRFVGVEGELGGGLGVRQTLTFNARTLTDQKTPSMLAYNGNLIVSPGGSDRPLVPYVAAGLGGLTMFNASDVEALGVTKDHTFLTMNTGGGVKWFAANGWGIRADYRFFRVQDQDNAPLFFGQGPRYGHRVYAGLLLTK
jgi:opacity protein-like surface antigen